MHKIQELDVETNDWRFSIEIFEKLDGQGFVAEYWGTTPKWNPSPPPGEPADTLRASSPKPIAVEGDQVDKLIDRCKREIAEGFGELLDA